MLPERVEKLRLDYVGRYVVVHSDRPELAQSRNRTGRVISINFNGRALVQFDGADTGWHDIELDYLEVVERPQPKAEKPADGAAAAGRNGEKPSNGKPADGATATDAESGGMLRLSRLELARLEKDKEEAAKAAVGDAHRI